MTLRTPRFEGRPMRIETEHGELRYPFLEPGVVVGDRLVPRIIEVDFPGIEEPGIYMVIEVLDGVPRCTELTIKSNEGGRGIRKRDLLAVDLDTWIETFVSWCSAGPIHAQVQNGIVNMYADTPGDEKAVREGMKTIRDVRKGSRMSASRKRRVAEIYNAHETGGIEAIERAFSVSRSTAIRYIRAAREADLIEKGTKNA